ncbi:DUF6266 family protein [Parapedobacter koreensis]|uniref:Uncharacterized protein n=1 Tax=Parapedobacter koreensis TaxID=332977 RepID=A0A1H7ISK2_9SPHI|nr:DUF6266 family protein [Parapedobacter koreensis]SEK64697.1 hypothetical protein SAMN05421740_102328 [Parapedobacter koreensis]
MGIIEQGINGPFKGKAGSVVGSSWKKINYIKGLRRDKGLKRPPTSEQAVQRQKFKLLNTFFIPLKTVLNAGFRSFTEKSTGVNSAFRYNYDHAFTTDGDNISLDYAALKFSHGSLCTAGAEQAWLDNGGIHVTWNPKTYGMGGEVDDISYAIAYSPKFHMFFVNSKENRQAGSARIDLPSKIRGTEIHAWLFFADKQRKRVSKTVYVPVSTPDLALQS